MQIILNNASKKLKKQQQTKNNIITDFTQYQQKFDAKMQDMKNEPLREKYEKRMTQLNSVYTDLLKEVGQIGIAYSQQEETNSNTIYIRPTVVNFQRNNEKA